MAKSKKKVEPVRLVGSVPSTRVKNPPPMQQARDPPPAVVSAWNEYFGSGDLPAWQRFMADLGIAGTFTSKTQCRKALRPVWVNITDFLEDVEEGRQPHHFKSQNDLRRYSRENEKIYPKRSIPKGSPLRSLLARIIA